MLKVAQLILSLVLTLLLAFSPIFQARARIEATSYIPVATSVGELNDRDLEKALVSEVHKVADQIFSEIKAKDPHTKVTQLKKVERAVIHKLKETGKLVEFARSLDPKVGISVVAVELFVTMGLAPMLIANGHVLAGTVVLNFPTAPLMLSLAVAYEVQKIRWKLARELNTSIRELDQIRKQVTDYNLKNRITSLIVQDGNVQRELELVKKFVETGEKSPQVVTLAEIEKAIAASPEGESFLAYAYHERGNKEVYSTLLIHFLDESPQTLIQVLEKLNLPSEERRSLLGNLAQKLMSSIESKSQTTLVSPELRKHLVEISDLQNHIDREITGARKEASLARKRVKSGEITKEEAASIKKHMKEEVKRLGEVRVQSFRHQYQLLLALKSDYQNGRRAEVKKIVAGYRAELTELRVLGSFARVRARVTSIAPMCRSIFASAH